MQLEKDTNWIHFTGIAGVALAPLAIELQKAGYKVTGSDKSVYDPVKTLLADSGIKFNLEYSYKNLLDGEKIPHLVITGAGVSIKNKELLFATKNNIAVRHFAESLEELVIENNSIVIAGTYAKTTITAMIVKILKEAGKDISFMYGGVPTDGSTSVKLQTGQTLFSVAEGDEYIASREDQKSKFFYYHPKMLVLTAVKWDHTDVFKTEDDYINNFAKLVKKIPADGIVYANKDDKNVEVVMKTAKCKVIWYSISEIKDWVKSNDISVPVLGSFNLINAGIAAKFSIEVLGLEIEQVRKALSKFSGIKRRLEIRYQSEKNDLHDSSLVIIDDFASSPPKVEGTISAIKEEFSQHKLVVVYEPNTGNRTENALSEFKDVFGGADTVILPKFKELLKSSKTEFLSENEFSEALNNEVKVLMRNSEENLTKEIVEQSKDKKTVVAFMSSQGMEDRIRNLISELESND